MAADILNKTDKNNFYSLPKIAKMLNYHSSVLWIVFIYLEKDGIKIEKQHLKCDKSKIKYRLDDSLINLINKKCKELKIKNKNSRYHYKIPNFKKVYSLYQYDQKKYNTIFKQIQKLAIRYNEHIFYNVNPYRVLNLCYVRDEFNKLQSLGDEKHIFRSRALQSILREIADILLNNYKLLPQSDVLKYLFKRTHIIVYLDNEINQAEILETVGKSISCRIKFHVLLLKNLRRGQEIEDAVNNAVHKFRNRFSI